MSWFSWFCSPSILSSPSASSTMSAKGLEGCRPCSFRLSPTLRMFSRPSSATVTMRLSLTVNRSHIGLMAPCSTRCLIWSCVPPDVALLIAHAASFLMSNSAVASRCTSGVMMPVSMTAWICSFVPAVMLEMVQHASFLMLFLWLDCSSASRQLSTLQFTTTCVCMSSPVTMLPTVRSAGTMTGGALCMSSSTRRRHTLASITAWILSLVPSDR
mmetsp:Transcript_17524/g.44513  ORF Transcript_17524/g.44513 Transcript_17524/m.44513 type:complete len:214 (+) Transcript_17524:601-1242(+)